MPGRDAVALPTVSSIAPVSLSQHPSQAIANQMHFEETGDCIEALSEKSGG